MAPHGLSVHPTVPDNMSDDFSKLIAVLDFARVSATKASASSSQGYLDKEALRHHTASASVAPSRAPGWQGATPSSRKRGANSVAAKSEHKSEEESERATVLRHLRATPKNRAKKSKSSKHRPDESEEEDRAEQSDRSHQYKKCSGVHLEESDNEFEDQDWRKDHAEAPTEVGSAFSTSIAAGGEGVARRHHRHRAGKKHQTLAYQARVARESAARAIEAAELASEKALAAEANSQKARRHQAGNRQASVGSSSPATSTRWNPNSHLPEPPGVPLDHTVKGDGDRGHAPGDGIGTKRVLDYDQEWKEGEAKEDLRITGFSRKIMGLLRYGNIGRGRQKIEVPGLGWRHASDIAELLGLSTSDVLRATRTSIDWRGCPRFEYENIHDTDPRCRPVHNTASRERL